MYILYIQKNGSWFRNDTLKNYKLRSFETKQKNRIKTMKEVTLVF